MDPTNTFAVTSPKLDAKAVLLELEQLKADRLKLLEQRWRNDGHSEIQVQRLKRLAQNNTTNGFQYHALFPTWKGMMARCYNPKHVAFRRYGGAGIRVCDQWHWFPQFVADLPPRPKGKTLDRWPKRNGNYEPGNVRWATRREQLDNSSVPTLIEFNGKTQCLSDWSRELGIGVSTLVWRLSQGWPAEKVLRIGGPPRRTHCPQGHLHSESNTRITKDGWQSCRICRAKYAREWRKTHDYKRKRKA